MMKPFPVRILLAGWIVSTLLVRSWAGEVSVQPAATNPSSGSGNTVLVTIVGPIDDKISKDFEERIRPYLNPVYVNTDSRGSIMLRLLNSRGGKISYALKIAKIVREQRITTFVPKESECLSACALIFLAGKQSFYAMEDQVSRILEVGGVVGFHGPYDEADGSRPTMLTEGVIIMSQIMSALGEAMPRDLYTEMAVIPPTETKNIDSVYDALRWDIQLVGHKKPPAGREGLLNACINTFRWKHVEQIAAIEGVDLDKQVPDFLKDRYQQTVLDGRQEAVKANNYILPDEENGLVRNIRETWKAPDFLRDLRAADGSYASQFGFTHEDESMAYWCSAIHHASRNELSIYPQRQFRLGEFLAGKRSAPPERPYIVPEWFEFPPGAKLSDIKAGK